MSHHTAYDRDKAGAPDDLEELEAAAAILDRAQHDGQGPNEHGQYALVTIHMPIEAGVFAAVCKAVSRRYKDAVLGENGVIYDRPPRRRPVFGVDDSGDPMPMVRAPGR